MPLCDTLWRYKGTVFRKLWFVKTGKQNCTFSSVLQLCTLIVNSGDCFPATFSAAFAAVTFSLWTFGKCAVFGRRFLGRPPLPAAVFWQAFCRASEPLGSGFNHVASADVTSEMAECNEGEKEGSQEKTGGVHAFTHCGSLVRAVSVATKSCRE